MKEKTKAFYKTIFKYWVKEKLTPFAIMLVVMFIVGFVFHVMGWDMGAMALTLITWQKVKEVWSGRK